VAPAAKSKPGRYLAVVALALVGLYLGLFLGPSQTPKLGLDLRGGTEVTLTAHPINGTTISKSALNQAVNIIRQRANGLGVGGAEVSTQGGANIVVDIPGKGSQVVNTIGQTALLRFRQVMQFASPVPASSTTASPTPTASGSTKATPKKSSTAKPKKKKKSSSQGRPLSSALVKAKATATASPTPTPTPATPTPTTSASPATTTTTTSNTDQPLPGSQSPTLTAAFQKSFANWDCTKATTANPTQGADNPNDYIIGCGNNGSGLEKFLLAPAKVEGTQVKSAGAALDTQGTGDWVVNLNFNGSGASAWLKLTATAYNADPTNANAQTCAPPTGCNSVAIVLDGNVTSAPTITQAGGIAGGQAQITGGFTQSTATQLADILKYGSLPLRFTAPSIQSISPTLGSEQLRGGLIAGAIGLGLVILFSLLYYRALGLVTIGSLAISGLILYAVTTLLGHSSVGYTLSLPGIAGFIVAVGITADSFVVFFERLRDEVREGIRLRSAVERAWPRARRTIISADSVSLLAAVILYVVSIGDVRGFAFTLGLSTISDLFIVFFFTKPLLTVLARQPAFDRGKGWTGIGRPREGAQLRDDDSVPTRRRPRRTREA
jgi:preprotein translocase subunit SecD